ncbi:hypothetical protein CEE44_00915 [Candidatus Woesearchaeota archaeon B3_Woes]|nr:MAG: hypothetical protein CEE44_00915 [Candidatus Woesearchaeota archaeon B3_Woes]
MFVRLKKIKDKYYAYHVQNKRVRGKVKQKVKGYIGRAYFPKKTNEKDFFEFVNENINNYNKPFKEIIEDLIKWEFLKHNLKDIELDKFLIKKDNNKIILKLNEGYLYDKTIKNMIKFQPVGDDEYIIGKEFAEVFVKAGIDIPKELFVKLFEKIIKN